MKEFSYCRQISMKLAHLSFRANKSWMVESSRLSILNYRHRVMTLKMAKVEDSLRARVNLKWVIYPVEMLTKKSHRLWWVTKITTSWSKSATRLCQTKMFSDRLNLENQNLSLLNRKRVSSISQEMLNKIISIGKKGDSLDCKEVSWDLTFRNSSQKFKFSPSEA